jgi:dTDP-4-dehydrorhamnose 3,5-epimerase
MGNCSTPADGTGGQSISRLVAGREISGVQLRPLKMNHDARGCFIEVFQKHWGTCIDPVQWSIVHSRPNVFRGVHLHRRHDEYVAPITGRMTVGLRDFAALVGDARRVGDV